MTIAKVHICGLCIRYSCNNAPVVLIQSQTPRFFLRKLRCSKQLLWLVVQTDNSNCDATMNIDYRGAIGPNDKSPLHSICVMLE